MSHQSLVLVTCEYPPDVGGVAGYTQQLAGALSAAGTPVHVLAPGQGNGIAQDGPVTVSRALGALGRSDLWRADLELDRRGRANHLIVQWVPHGYGRRSMNVGFARWIARRAAHGDVVDVMVHEPRLRFDAGLRLHNAIVPVHWVMLRAVVGRAARVWTSTEAFVPYVRPHVRSGVNPMPLPVPSPIQPHEAGDQEIAAARERLAPSGGPVIGHFSAFGPHTCTALVSLLPALADRNPDVSFALIGSGSNRCRDLLLRACGRLPVRIVATGGLGDREISAHLAACDVMIQPYEDGVTTRRSSLIASLAHGVPVVTNPGCATETLWRSSQAIVLATSDRRSFAGAVRELLDAPARRDELRRQALALYDSTFHVRHTVAAVIGS